LVVLMEIPLSARPWREGEIAAERARLYQRIGTVPVQVDIGLRTTDHYEEAYRVVGGPEHLAATHGIPTYFRLPERSPVVRRTPDQVRFDNVNTWIKHSLLAANRAVTVDNARVLSSPGSMPQRDPQALARTAVERALNAVLVFHRIHVEKRISAHGMLARLAEVEPRTALGVQRLVDDGCQTPRAAYALVGTLLRRLAMEPRLATLLAPLLARPHQPVVFLGG
ncbi:MAG TPA: hypothetical protein VE913_19435, partial [Longimicrobium sp.]|nr:hypothetical protein [Longimicrobium sp.]